MVHAGLLPLPDGVPGSPSGTGTTPTADDWVLLLEGWVRYLRTTGRDDEVVERIREVLPSVGYQLTKRGIRRGRSPVDRVLARSEAKTVALTEIVEAEHRNLGHRLRMLVLCDHERATATLPADLDGVLVPAGRLRPARAGAPRAARARTCTRCSSPAGPWPGRRRR